MTILESEKHLDEEDLIPLRAVSRSVRNEIDRYLKRNPRKGGYLIVEGINQIEEALNYAQENPSFDWAFVARKVLVYKITAPNGYTDVDTYFVMLRNLLTIFGAVVEDFTFYWREDWSTNCLDETRKFFQDLHSLVMLTPNVQRLELQFWDDAFLCCEYILTELTNY